uniref:DEAD domain-containing protein n=1 Tax=Strongyloides stercoralis TaxID=6248 RepID=A0A0K0EA87_STRER
MEQVRRFFSDNYQNRPTKNQLKVIMTGLQGKQDMLIRGGEGKGKTVSAIVTALLKMKNDGIPTSKTRDQATQTDGTLLIDGGSNGRNDGDLIDGDLFDGDLLDGDLFDGEFLFPPSSQTINSVKASVKAIILTTDRTEVRRLIEAVKYIKSKLQIDGKILEVYGNTPLICMNKTDGEEIIVGDVNIFMDLCKMMVLPQLQTMIIDGCPAVAFNGFRASFINFVKSSIPSEGWNLYAIGRKVAGTTFAVWKEMLLKNFAIIDFDDEEPLEMPEYLRKPFKG